jgi:hypothetical protein
MTIELCWASGSPFSWRAMLALEVKTVAYTGHLMEFSKGEIRSSPQRLLFQRPQASLMHSTIIFARSPGRAVRSTWLIPLTRAPSPLRRAPGARKGAPFVAFASLFRRF